MKNFPARLVVFSLASIFIFHTAKVNAQYRDVYDKNGKVIPGGKVLPPVYKPEKTTTATPSTPDYESAGQKQARLKAERKESDRILKESYGIYDYIGSRADGLRPVLLNKKWGYINDAGEVVVPIIYEELKFTSSGLYGVKLNNYWGFVDRNGKVVVPLIYWSLVSEFNTDGMAKVAKGSDKNITVNRLGSVVPLSELLNKSIEASNAAMKRQAAEAAIQAAKIKAEADSKQAMLKKYEETRDFSDGLACVRSNGKWGLINEKGEIVTPFIYDSAFSLGGSTSMPASLVMRVEINKKYGYLDRHGKAITAVKYDYLGEFKSEFAFDVANVRLDGKWGALEETGREIIPLKYDHIISNSLLKTFVVKLNDKWGMVDYSDFAIIPIIYDTICTLNDLRKAESDYDGFIKAYGKEIIPYIFKCPGYLDDGTLPFRYKDYDSPVYSLVYFKLKGKFYPFSEAGMKLIKRKN